MDGARCHDAHITSIHFKGIPLKAVGAVAGGNIDYLHIVVIVQNRIAVAAMSCDAYI